MSFAFFPRNSRTSALVTSFIASVAACGATSESRHSENRAPVQPATLRDRRTPPVTVRSNGPETSGRGVSCEPGDSEICGCPGAISGVRRCSASGSELGACDACPDQLACGGSRCESLRIQLLEATLAPCCPRASHCGIDVSYFAQNHQLALGCLELEAPGIRDPECPSVDIALPVADAKTITLAGCRTTSGKCGYDVNLPAIVNLGCTAPPTTTGR